MNSIKNIAVIILAALLIGGGVLAIRTHNENKRLRSNAKNLVNEKLEMATTLLQTKKEMSRFVNVRFPELEAKLDSANIKIGRIQKVVIQKIYYRDTSANKIDLNPIVEAIQKGIYIKEPFQERKGCTIISGFIEFDGHKLNLTIDNREFKSNTEQVIHLVNRQWKFLGIFKTRVFGKRELKVTTFNECGESKTVVLTKKKGKWQRN